LLTNQNAYLSQKNVSTVDINSVLYRWDPEVNMFESTPFQTFESSAASDLAFLTLAS